MTNVGDRPALIPLSVAWLDVMEVVVVAVEVVEHVVAVSESQPVSSLNGSGALLARRRLVTGVLRGVDRKVRGWVPGVLNQAFRMLDVAVPAHRVHELARGLILWGLAMVESKSVPSAWSSFPSWRGVVSSGAMRVALIFDHVVTRSRWKSSCLNAGDVCQQSRGVERGGGWKRLSRVSIRSGGGVVCGIVVGFEVPPPCIPAWFRTA